MSSMLTLESVANEQGNRVTPSFVAFTNKERLIGDAAKNQAALNPRNTVFDAKYILFYLGSYYSTEGKTIADNLFVDT